jgi:uncharacterized protein (DUF488 family)
MSVIYTIGYEGTDIDRFIATLKHVGIEVLADIRAVTVSRKKGFSKTALRMRLEREGIIYAHFAELGDPKPGREAARAGRHREFRTLYTEHLSSTASQEVLRTLAKVVQSGRTCLLCFERDPNVCHRLIVAEHLKTDGVQIFNLYGDSPDRYVRHASKLPGCHTYQGSSKPEQ